MTLSKSYQIPSGVAAREVDDELVLLDLETGHYFGLNAVGAVGWQKLTEGATVQEAVDAVADAFDVDPAIARSDFLELVAELEAAHLIKARD